MNLLIFCQLLKFLREIFSVIMPVNAYIMRPDPIIDSDGLILQNSFISAFVRISVHFSFCFFEIGNSYLFCESMGILSSIYIFTGFPM